MDTLDSSRHNAEYLGYDQRYGHQALPSVGVDSGVTSVSLLTQTARTLAAPNVVVRAIDAVAAKPETTETLTVSTVSLKQLASVVSDIPNVFRKMPSPAYGRSDHASLYGPRVMGDSESQRGPCPSTRS